MSTSFQKGHGFEQLVGELYVKQGFSAEYNVRQQHGRKLPKQFRKKSQNKDKAFHEFDIVLEKGMWLAKSKLYVECKYRTEGKVPSEQVSWFVAKLRLHNIENNRGRMITNTSFQDSAIIYAHDVGLMLIDGQGLCDVYKKTLSFRNRLFGDSSPQKLERLIADYCL